MANRLNAPNQFESLSPPWLLTQLDTNFVQNQAAWNDSSLGFVNGIPVDTGAANAYVVALPFGSPTAYQDGMTVAFIPANSNTGASTITVSPLGTVAILDSGGNALTGGELAVNRAVTITYKSAVPTGFRITGNQYVAVTGSFSSSANQSVVCDGASSVSVIYTFTASATASLTLTHLRPGVPVTIEINFQAFTSTLQIAGTNPQGGSYGGNLVVQGSAGLQTGVSSTNGTLFVGNGMALGNNIVMQFTHP